TRPAAEDAADRAADHHAEHAGGLNRDEGRPLQAPFAHHRRHCRAEQLIVEPVEDDRRRRRGDEELLIRAPVRVVQQRADVDRLMADQGLRPNSGWPRSSVSRHRYWLFSWQMYSASSPFARHGMFHAAVHGFVYAPGSSIVTS